MIEGELGVGDQDNNSDTFYTGQFLKSLRQPVITIVTNHGEIVVELFEEAAPISCENFRQYIED